MLGLQFWLNMPRAQKMDEPRYNGATKDKVPVVQEAGAAVRIIAGEYQGRPGALSPGHIKALFIDVDLQKDAAWSFAADPEATIYLYILEGDGEFDANGKPVARKHAILFDQGDEIKVKAGSDGVRFVLCQARPLHEPVAWGGPIVMNTREELNQAFDELEKGTFIKNAS